MLLLSSSAFRQTSVDLGNLYKAPQAVDNYLGAYPELAPIAAQPQAKWINTQADADNMGQFITAAAGKTTIFSIYGIPGRDNGGYSSGGFPDRASYLNFIQTIKTKIGNTPAILLYEPDALGHTPDMTQANRDERIETMRQAVNILATITNAETYIEASQWIAPATQAGLLQSVDIVKAHGFLVNTSGYDAQSSCYTYSNSVITQLESLGIRGKKFFVDSSRNGNGPLTEADRPLASPWLDTNQPWCNPPKRRLGLNPGTVTGQANARGTLWVKNPGESDGNFPTTAQSSYYGENAPGAGGFFVPMARDLLGLTPQKSSRDITTIPNLNGWWQADSLNLADGAAVASWGDSGPGAYTATQSNAASRPAFATNVLNAKPVVRFTTDRLDTGMSASENAQTIFAVAKPTSLTRINTILGSDGGGGRQFRFNEEGRIEWLAQGEEGTTKSSVVASTTAFQIATGSITASGAYNYWMNGSAAGGGTWTRGFTSGRLSHIGFSSSAAEEFIGDIAEIISFNRVLTASERAQVHSYLQDKYAITTADYVAASNSKMETLSANFTNDFGPFTNQSAGASRTGGRLRINAGTGYDNAATKDQYTLKDSSIFARLYPAAGTGAGVCTNQFIVATNTAADGTRLLAQVETVANELYIGKEVGYYDGSGVRIAYNATSMAWLRWREAGGTVYLDTSPDAVTWTNRFSSATPSWLTSTANQRAQFVVYKDAGAATYAEVDDVNLAPTSTTTTRTNLIANPSFEHQFLDAGYSRYGIDAAAQFVKDTTQFVVGAASMKLVSTDGNRDMGQVAEFDTLPAGSYVASVWIKTDSVQNASFTVRTRPDYSAIQTIMLTGTNAWQRVSIPFTINAATIVDVVLGLGSYGVRSGGTVWYDGVLLETGTTLKPYFDGSYSATSGAQTAWTGEAHNSRSTETVQNSQQFSGTAAPSGEGTTFNGTPTPRFTVGVSPSASGTATGTGAPRAIVSAATSGDGSDTANGSPRVIVAGSTSADGTTAASGTLVASGSVSTSAEGTDQASGVPRFVSTVAASANSTTAASGTSALVATVAATGSGTAAGTGRPSFAVSVATDSAGTATPTGGPSYGGTVATSGEGTTAGAGSPRPAGSGATSGAGTATASGTARFTAAVSTSGDGNDTSTTRPSFSTAAATSAEGTSTSAGSISYSGSVATSGEGTTTAAGTLVRVNGAASPNASGTATGSGRIATAGNAAASGSGTAAPTATVRVPGSADSTSEGTTSSSVSVAYSGSGSTDGSGTTTAAGQPRPIGTAGASGSGTTSGAGVPRPIASVATSADGTDAVSGAAPRFIVTATPNANGSDVATGQPRFLGAASPNADGTDTAAGNPRAIAQGSTSSVGTANTSAQGSANGTADSTGSGTATSSASLAVASSTTTSAAGTATGNGSKSVTVAATPSGSGTVTTSGVSPRLIGSGVTSGSGTTGAIQAGVAFVGAVASPSGDGVDTATGRPRFVVSVAEDSNSGATTSYTSVQFASGDATASGEGSLAQGYTNPRPMGAGSTSGSGSVSATGRPRFIAGGSTSGSGNDTALQTGILFTGAAFPSGLGEVVGDGVASVVTISASRLYELTLQRRNTHAYILSDPTTVVLRRESFTSDGAGGFRSTVTLQPSQIFRIISSGNVGSNQRIDSVDGANTETAATLLAEWDADLKVNDEFDVDAQRFKVRSVTNLNSYELFADLEIVSL